MTDAATPIPHGLPVPDTEDLFRCLTHAKWWNDTANRVSSAAFSWPVFSVDIVSISGSEEATLKPFKPGTGLVIFNCGRSREKGCDPRHELDEKQPENKAHAHAYMPVQSGQRKRAVQHLIDICTVRRKPNLTT